MTLQREQPNGVDMCLFQDSNTPGSRPPGDVPVRGLRRQDQDLWTQPGPGSSPLGPGHVDV